VWSNSSNANTSGINPFESNSATITVNTVGAEPYQATWNFRYFAQFCKLNTNLTDIEGTFNEGTPEGYLTDAYRSEMTQCKWNVNPENTKPGDKLVIFVDYNLQKVGDQITIYERNGSIIHSAKGPNVQKMGVELRPKDMGFSVVFISNNPSDPSTATFFLRYSIPTATVSPGTTPSPSPSTTNLAESGATRTIMLYFSFVSLILSLL
jgi:hypothetical protein